MLVPLASYGKDPVPWLQRIAASLERPPPAFSEGLTAGHRNNAHGKTDAEAVAGLRLWYCRRYNYGTRRIYGDTLAQVVFQMLCSVRWMPHRPIWPVASPM